MKLTPEQKLAHIYLILLGYSEKQTDPVKAVKAIKKVILERQLHK